LLCDRTGEGFAKLAIDLELVVNDPDTFWRNELSLVISF
jgi:hypothetical protein